MEFCVAKLRAIRQNCTLLHSVPPLRVIFALDRQSGSRHAAAGGATLRTMRAMYRLIVIWGIILQLEIHLYYDGVFEENLQAIGEAYSRMPIVQKSNASYISLTLKRPHPLRSPRSSLPFLHIVNTMVILYIWMDLDCKGGVSSLLLGFGCCSFRPKD